ncbi:aminoglycoside phosphotransferase family protein [Micromonospora sp. RTP1Z1]|uniref:aminoglycoside phosphotransferase family protein n=1 Tax=Micromonospora sp. RTP1Z1 TaxID=2994043 RepID=UPI0029C84240|nr:aminoglycoside phosphotransferase family protein [Micromonospora sp. RTP1Z1]
MHDGEVATDEALVRRLIAAQFPQWARLPVERISSAGTNNAIYRLGPELAVRLPRIADAIEQVEFEYAWLPRLAPYSPVAVPEPVALGQPAEGYPWRWAVNRWVDGRTAVEDDADRPGFAVDLGEFVAALRRADVTGGRPGYRSGSLRTRDAYVREWTTAARDVVDTGAVLAAWEEALAAPAWDGPPVWTHGDLLTGNVLVRDGRLAGVIDFGAAGVGDPACDAIPAWAVLSAGTRDAFRAAAGFDDATWARGRGWALTFVAGLTYYRETNPVMAGIARRAIDAVLATPA